MCSSIKLIRINVSNVILERFQKVQQFEIIIKITISTEKFQHHTKKIFSQDKYIGQYISHYPYTL